MAVSNWQQALRECQETIGSALMYLYETYRSSGMADKDAKEAVATELGRQLENWQTVTGLTFAQSAVINPVRVLDEVIEKARKEAESAKDPDQRGSWQQVYRRLVDLKAVVRK